MYYILYKINIKLKILFVKCIFLILLLKDERPKNNFQKITRRARGVMV
jgi:hypothetical protein